MKIAVLFRGPVRPNPAKVVERYNEFMTHFKNIDPRIEIHTYLATWRVWKEYKASELMALDLFDNVIMQTAPTEEHRKRCTALTKLPNGANIEPVFNMYYQSKTALDLIVNADTYSFIVHTRTDLQMIMCQDLSQWFDPNYYVTLHAKPNPWTCDQYGVATGEMMHKAWNYKSIENLGKMIESADKPEAILEMMMEAANVPVRTAPYVAWNLDPMRNR
jgi:hypothetical protein